MKTSKPMKPSNVQLAAVRRQAVRDAVGAAERTIARRQADRAKTTSARTREEIDYQIEGLREQLAELRRDLARLDIPGVAVEADEEW